MKTTTCCGTTVYLLFNTTMRSIWDTYGTEAAYELFQGRCIKCGKEFLAVERQVE